MRVSVLAGGPSFERQVSLAGAQRVELALLRLGHEVTVIDVGRDLVGRLQEADPEAAIVALHGEIGEDGSIQEVLSALGILQQSPGPDACRRCWDKSIAKGLLSEGGVAVPEGIAFEQEPFKALGAARVLGAVADRIGLPLIVKPARQGSALGVRLVRAASELAGAIVTAFSYDTKVIVEPFIEGREFAVSVVAGEALPIVEIIPGADHQFDFEARYSVGATRYDVPADLTPAETESVRATALRAAEILGVGPGLVRIDIILPPAGPPTVLELNMVPGMTDTSLLPMAADAAGWGFDGLVARMLHEAP